MIGLNPRTMDAYRLLHDGVLALSRAEQQGIRVDMDYLDRTKRQLTRKIKNQEEAFRETKLFHHWEHVAGKNVNIYSSTQLGHFLYDIKKIKVDKETISGQGSVDDEALKNMNIPELNLLLEIRKLKKIRDTYIDSFEREQVDGYIHPSFNLHLVQTFRSSSHSPNFQNIPKRDEEAMQIVRGALFPRPGNQLMEVDLSGAEVRLAACYHKDSTMIKYIMDPKSDMHADMAKQLFILSKVDKKIAWHNTLRQAAKNGFVFPQFYGDYYKSCAANLACTWGKLPKGKWSRGEGIQLDTEQYSLADHMISKGIKSLDDYVQHVKEIETDFWGNRFAEYAAWKDRWYSIYKKYGYVDLLTGFRCSGLMDKKQTINYPVQGAAFHCLLWSFTQLDAVMRKEGWNTKLIGQIHDSIVLDVDPKELNEVLTATKKIITEKLREHWDWLIVPIDSDTELCAVDCSWADKEKLK